jgi:hypothetical protein
MKTDTLLNALHERTRVAVLASAALLALSGCGWEEEREDSLESEANLSRFENGKLELQLYQFSQGAENRLSATVRASTKACDAAPEGTTATLNGQQLSFITLGRYLAFDSLPPYSGGSYCSDPLLYEQLAPEVLAEGSTARLSLTHSTGQLSMEVPDAFVPGRHFFPVRGDPSSVRPGEELTFSWGHTVDGLAVTTVFFREVGDTNNQHTRNLPHRLEGSELKVRIPEDMSALEGTLSIVSDVLLRSSRCEGVALCTSSLSQVDAFESRISP